MGGLKAAGFHTLTYGSNPKMCSHQTTTIRWPTVNKRWPISPTEENSDHEREGQVWRETVRGCECGVGRGGRAEVEAPCGTPREILGFFLSKVLLDWAIWASYRVGPL
ncbi:hypothetical protein ES332_A03G181700v1 [Gossypium tomentosum]|uniref:Uncharacterized protein n=1 Tax=Gossypium tomentosum TaxID=34277 RepID=A0A5D2R843_GOSTO|nr:hypothetical protein ES332_A03G181700v1 [Gossypium tomentosum]